MDDEIETDYLVVGAGAAGRGFADALLAHCDATIAIVDRRHAPGGHWIDAYPYVRLHQTVRLLRRQFGSVRPRRPRRSGNECRLLRHGGPRAVADLLKRSATARICVSLDHAGTSTALFVRWHAYNLRAGINHGAMSYLRLLSDRGQTEEIGHGKSSVSVSAAIRQPFWINKCASEP